MKIGVICYILYDINFNNTKNCISSNDHLADCVLKWSNMAPYFMRKETKAVKAVIE